MAFQVEASLLIWGLFWKVDFLVQSCLYHFCLKRGLWLKSIFEKWVILVNMPQGIKDDFKVSRSWGLCFWSLKEFGRFKAITSLDVYQITKCQFFQKLIIFCCLIFEEFVKKFLNQEFYGQLPEQAWSKGLFDFSKIMPLGAPRSLIQMVSK